MSKSLFFWGALVALASVIRYQTSYRAQEQATELAQLNRHIVAEQEAIQVLKAEWAYLNEPTRLERLADRHTGLIPTTVANITTLDRIPEKPALPGPIDPDAPPAPPLLLSSAEVPGKADKQPSVAHQPAIKKPAAPGPVLLASFGNAQAREAEE